MIAVRLSVQCVARASPGAGHPPHRPAPPARGARLPVAVPFTAFAPSEPPAVPAHNEAKGERVIGLLTDLLEAQVRRAVLPATPTGAAAAGADRKP